MKKTLLLACLCLSSITKVLAQCPQNPDFTVNVGQTSSDLIAMNGGNAFFNNQDIIIYGDFLVQDDLSFVGCDIYMGPSATISMTTTTYHTLSVINTNIQACTDHLWTGIHYRYGLVKLSEALVRDAFVALDASGTDAQTKFEIKNSQFLNNRTHLTVRNQIDLTSFVHSTDFEVQGNLLPPFQNLEAAHIAIDVQYVLDWTFGIDDENLSNNVSHFQTGLKATNARLDLKHTHFSNPSPSGIGVLAQGQTLQNHQLNVDHCQFELLQNGMMLSRTHTLTKNSLFDQSFVGIFTEFSQDKEIRVEFNDFYNCTKVAIYHFADDGATIRIAKNTIINSPQAIISSNLNPNNFNTDFIAKANCIINAYHAVTIINTPQAAFYYNDVQSSHTGLSLAGSQGAVILDNDFVGAANAAKGIYAAQSQQSRYDQNRLQGYSDGMHLAGDYHSQLTNNIFVDGDNGIKLTNNSILGPQGSEQQPQNNHWLQPHFAEIPGYNKPLETDGSSNENDATFFYKPNVPELKPWNTSAANIYPTNNGQVAPTINYYDCLAQLPEDLPLTPAIVPPLPSESDDYSPSRYIQELQLLALLDQLPQQELSTEQQDFLSQKQSTTQEQIVRLRQELEQADYSQAQDRNQGLSPTNPIEDFTKTFYNTLLLCLQDSAPIINLSPQDQANIRQWAALCPFEYGPEVYAARVMAHRIDTAWQSYAHPCEGSIPNTLARLPGKEEGLTVYPNPFVDKIMLEDSIHRIELYDMLGHCHYRQSHLQAPHSIDLSALPQGLYLLKTYNSQGKDMGQQKLLKSQ